MYGRGTGATEAADNVRGSAVPYRTWDAHLTYSQDFVLGYFRVIPFGDAL